MEGMSTETPPGDRIAKVIARAGRASRREAERMIEEGRVTVNGEVVTSPALNVTDRDRIVVDNEPLEAAEEARMWLYYKPNGLVTTNKDEKGRATIFDELPEDMPRVMSVGRLDLNSEGLLLLTNDGALKRKLELPSTGWLRRYRVRVNGRPTDPQLQPLRDGITIDGENFQPMIVSLDRQQGANAWLTVGLREGKNREIRRAMADIGLTVNRLIRISYGPFQLGQMKEGEVIEVRRKVLRDQLGMADAPEDTGGEAKPKPRVQRNRKPGPASGVPGTARRDGKPAGKPFGKSGDKPSAKPGRPGKPTAKPSGKPFGKSSDKPSGRSFGKSSATPDSRTDRESPRAFGARPGGKTGGKPGGKPGQRKAKAPGPRSDGPSRPKNGPKRPPR